MLNTFYLPRQHKEILLTLALFLSAIFTILPAQELEIKLLQLNESEKISFILEQTSTPTENKGESLRILRKGLQLCQKNKDFDTKIVLFLNGSRIAEGLGDQALAISFLDNAFTLASELKDPMTSGKILIEKGDLYVRFGLLEESLNQYIQASELFERERNPEFAIKTLVLTSIVHAKLGERAEALQLAEQAATAALAVKDSNLQGIASKNKGLVHLIIDGIEADLVRDNILISVRQISGDDDRVFKNDPYPGLKPIEEAISHFEEAENLIGQAECLHLKGKISQFTGNQSDAIQFYEHALNIYTEQQEEGASLINLYIALAFAKVEHGEFSQAYEAVDAAMETTIDPETTVWIQLLQAQIALEEQNDSFAKEITLSAISEAQKNNHLEQLQELYQLMSKVQMNLGNFPESLRSLQLAHTYSMRLIKSQSNNIQANSQKKNELQLQALEEQAHKKQTELQSRIFSQQTYIKIGWIVCSILGVCFIAIIVTRNQKIKSTKQQLEDTEQTGEELQKIARDRNLERNHLFKSLAHELRTPMNGIVGAIPLLNDTTMTPLQENCVNIIDISSRSILTLINDISDLSKLDSGDFSLANKSFDLIKTAETVAQLFEKDASNTEVEIVIETPSDPIPILSGDIDRIQQIILTLLGRSFQTTSSGTISAKIETLEPREDRVLEVQITVENTGDKVTEEDIIQAFDISPHNTNINSLRQPASMLGMSITQKLVNAMKGTIDISPRVNGGIKTVITLPFSLHPRLDHWQFPTPYQRFPEKTALFIDSSIASRMVFETHLKAWGIDSKHASNFESAQQFIHSDYSFDLIFLNAYQEENELTILEKISVIRSAEPTANTPIILLNSQANTSVSRELKRQKYVHQTTKLIRIDELHACVKQAILFKSPLTQSFATLTPEPTSTDQSESEEEYPLDPNGNFHFIPYILPFRSKAKINTNLKILLAEDNIVNQKVTSLMLKKMGFSIDIVTNGQEAVEAVTAGKYDVVLMDKLMPVMDGIESTLTIRKLEKINQPIIIALTASASMEDEIACRKATMDNFLAKPVQFEKMKAALAFATNALKNRTENEA